MALSSSNKEPAEDSGGSALGGGSAPGGGSAASGGPIFLNLNGRLFPDTEPLLDASNRGFRFGEGLFETMLARKGNLPLADFHFDRLFRGMKSLGYSVPQDADRDHSLNPLTPGSLAEQVAELCRRNRHLDLARVRLTVYPDENGRASYIIQTFAYLPEEIPAGGLSLGLFPDGRKSRDAFSHIKSNNYQLFALAARYAQGKGWNDALVLNDRERLAESSVANLFYIRGGVICTPPLSEGCVEGVMRRILLESLPGSGFHVREQAIGPNELREADEIFLTNALRGIRWIGQYGGRAYPGEIVGRVRDSLRAYLQD
jgi:branched-chain amino acid aminotransferase